MENIVILGTGCAGLTAAIYAARANLNPLVLEGKQPGGQLTTTSEVENFPGFPEGIDGFMLMDSLRKQALKFGAKIENAYIKSVRLDENVKVLSSESKEYLSKSIIIATGAAPSFWVLRVNRRCMEATELLHVQLVMVLFTVEWM